MRHSRRQSHETRIEQAGTDPSLKSGNNPREPMTTETKELVIEARIPLPEDYFEESEVAAKVKTAADSFREGLAQQLGDGFKVFVTRTTPKAPRKPRQVRSDAGEANPARGRRNGAAEQATA